MPPAAAPDEWTQVTSKSKRHKPKPPPSARDPKIAPATPSVSPEQLRAEYASYRAQFEAGPACASLCEFLAAAAAAGGAGGGRAPITTAVCLGTGSFDDDRFGLDNKRQAFTQLAAFLVMVEKLGEHSSQPIRCFFQEPVYHDVDIAFLEGLSPLHTVVATPDAYQHVTPSTLLFGIHLYRSVTRDAMAASIPGIFVGTDWWLYESAAATAGPDGALTEPPMRIKELEDDPGCKKWVFPRSRTDHCFSSTAVYWRGRAEEGAAKAPPQPPAVDGMQGLRGEPAMSVSMSSLDDVREGVDVCVALTPLSMDPR